MSPLPQLPMARPHPLTVAPMMRRLHATGPVHRVRTAVGDEAWLITGYDEVRRMLNDDRLGRSHPDPASAARVSDSALFGGPVGNFATEAADHAWMRSQWQPHFSPRRMRAFRPRIETLAGGLLDDLAKAGPPADLHQALALPLPILVICELLGVPYEDRSMFRAWSEAAIDMDDRKRSRAGMTELVAYTKTLAGRKRENPGDDVISHMCRDLDDDDKVAGLAWALLFAGHETTVIEIGYAAVLLFSNPGQRRTLLDDPALLPTAVEECLRAGAINSGGMGIPRYPRSDIEVAGVTIPAGDLVLLDNDAANRDDAAFPDSGRFDVARRDAGHVTFGHGSYYCIGAPLARIELQVVLERLVPRFPEMRLTVPIDELPVRTGALTGGFTKIPVTW